ncbi:hypothetical protein CWC38_10470 [Kocuria tytonicola]|uniref:AAA family ATPase n=1 Tax=Kocuria tytonicola TaxID=2055946 RepID=UPI000EF85B48|nr:ParA family protein [Kocuria tytonicola]RLZ02560.1 hypothetical protein CWC38_10470 [Kocuria tytonicola]
MSISVVTLGSSTWELVDRLERLHGDVTVVRRCLELADLLACAHTGMAQAALVAEGAEDLTASILEQLAVNGLRVLVVEGHDSSRLARLGVEAVPSGVSGEDLAARLEHAVDQPFPDRTADSSSDIPAPPSAHDEPATTSSGARPPGVPAGPGPAGSAPTGRSGVVGRGPAVDAGSRRAGDDGEDETEWVPDAHENAPVHESAPDPHRVVAVWGPAGAPGRTVTALNVAAEAALLGHRVLLVDADTCAASVAASLGMLDETAGLAQACRLADQGRLDREGLARCVSAVSVAGTTLDVLTGITRADRWPEVRGLALDTVLERAREEYGLVVVDTAFSLESDEEISTDFLAPRRNAGTLGAVAAADTVLAVGAADTLGIPRLVKALPELEEAAPDVRVVVVVNKLRAAAAGRSAAAFVVEAWRRFSPGHAIAGTLPWDPAACDDALLAGAVLAETAPRSALRQEFTSLARRLVADGGPPTVAGPGGAGETVTGTRLGRRMGAWLRRG